MTNQQMSMFAATPPRDTLAEAAAQVKAKLDDGVTCPCCQQFAKRYRRKIHATMAACLIVLYRADDPMTSKEIGDQLRRLKTAYATGEIGKLCYWGLVVEAGNKRWRLTDDGKRFVEGTHRVRRFALVFNGKCEATDGEFVGIRDALSDRFDYDELMRTKP